MSGSDVALSFPADNQIEYIGKPGTEEEKLVRRGIDIIRMSRNVRNLIEFQWAKSNDLYDSKFDKKEMAHSEFLGVPRIFIPKTYAQTQRMLEEVLEQFFFDVEEFCSIRSWKNVPRETLDIVKALINYRLNDHPIQSYQEVYEFCQDGIKNKVGIFKVYPRFKIVKKEGRKFIVDENANEVPPPGKDASIEELVQFFSPIVECVPYEDIFLHFESTWKDYWRNPIVHRVKRSRDYCTKRGYKNVDLIPWAGTFPGTDLIKMQRSLNQGSPFSGAPEDIQEQQYIWIYECWDLQPGKFGYLESGSFVLGGSAERPMALMRGWVKNELPYQFDPTEPVRPPFIVGTAFPESHGMYGKDLPQVTEGLQKETNARFNSEREASARALRPPVLVNRNSNVDLMALMIRKIGGVVQGNDIGPESIREMEIANPIPISLPGQQRTDQLYTEISSIGPDQMGASQPGSEDQSATASSTQSTNANKKMNMVIRNLTQTGIIPMLRFLLRLEQEYESDTLIEQVTGRVLGWKFVKDSKGEYVGPRPSVVIQGDFDLQISVGINKQNQLAQLRTITELGSQANGALVQALQAHAVKATDVKFFNSMWAFKQMAKLLGQKNTDEMMYPAMQPPPPQGAQGGGAQMPSAPGVSGANDSGTNEYFVTTMKLSIEERNYEEEIRFEAVQAQAWQSAITQDEDLEIWINSGNWKFLKEKILNDLEQSAFRTIKNPDFDPANFSQVAQFKALCQTIDLIEARINQRLATVRNARTQLKKLELDSTLNQGRERRIKMATKIKDSATAEKAALKLNEGIEVPAKTGEPPAPREKTTTEKLFPDFMTDDGAIVNRPIRSRTEESVQVPASVTPIPVPQGQTPPTQAPTEPVYVSESDLKGKMVKLKVDGIEQDVPATELVKLTQLERHSNAQLMKIAQERAQLERDRQEFLSRPTVQTPEQKPTKQEPPVKTTPELEAIRAEMAQLRAERAQEQQLLQPQIQEAGIKRVEQKIKEATGFDDYRAYHDKVREVALSEASKAHAAGDMNAVRFFDSDTYYTQKYQELKLKDLAVKASIPPVPTPNPQAPVLQDTDGAPVVMNNNGQPVSIPSFESSSGVPSTPSNASDWQATYNTLLTRATQTPTDENWMALMRHKFRSE